MLTYVAPTVRSNTTIEAINAMEPEVPPFVIVCFFVDTCSLDSFEERFLQLIPELQAAVRRNAFHNFDNFDNIIRVSLEDGEYTDGWIAYRDWARKDPWVVAESAKGQRPPLTYGPVTSERQRSRIDEQGWVLAQLRIERMRATTDEARAAIDARIASTKAEFEKENARG